MAKDSLLSIQALKDKIANFVDERQWQKFHNPKNLVTSIAVEAAELMEVFQWLSTEESLSDRLEPHCLERAKEELADVLIYCLSLANALEIDLASVVLAKVKENETKYPADQFRGKYER